jgi:clan AA aspartic protease
VGTVHTNAKIWSTTNGREPVELDLVVDTGAIFTLIPRSVLERLGVEAKGKRQFRTIDGSPMERDVGVIEIEVQGEQPPGPIPVIFGGESDSAVLGVTALEAMGLTVDPSTGALNRTDMLMLAVS